MKKWLIVIIACLAFGSMAIADQKDFRNINWGMSKEEVIHSEKDAPQRLDKDKNTLYYKTNVLGYSTDLSYQFVDGKLVSSGYVFAIPLYSSGYGQRPDDFKNRVDFHDTLKAALIKKYGDPTENNDGFVNESFKSLPGNIGDHIAFGNYILNSKWVKDQTVIVLECKAANTFFSTNVLNYLTYYSKDYYLKAINPSQDTEDLSDL